MAINEQEAKELFGTPPDVSGYNTTTPVEPANPVHITRKSSQIR